MFLFYKSLQTILWMPTLKKKNIDITYPQKLYPQILLFLLRISGQKTDTRTFYTINEKVIATGNNNNNNNNNDNNSP